MYPSLERKKCHCASDKALPFYFLFFRRGKAFLSQQDFPLIRRDVNVRNKSEEETTPSLEKLPEKFEKTPQRVLKKIKDWNNIDFTSLPFTLHSMRGRKIWVRTFLVTRRKKEEASCRVKNHENSLSERRKSIVARKLFFSPFYTKVKEWLNVESSAAASRAKEKLNFMHACPLTRHRERFSRNAAAAAELLDNFFSRVVLSGIFLLLALQLKISIGYLTKRIKLIIDFFPLRPKLFTRLVKRVTHVHSNTTSGKFVSDKTWVHV